MLTYQQLKDKPRDFLAATGHTVAEFEQLLPVYQTAYEDHYPSHLTLAGKERQRQSGGGSKGVLKDGISDMVMEIDCGLHNLRVSQRHPLPDFDLRKLA